MVALTTLLTSARPSDVSARHTPSGVTGGAPSRDAKRNKAASFSPTYFCSASGASLSGVVVVMVHGFQESVHTRRFMTVWITYSS